MPRALVAFGVRSHLSDPKTAIEEVQSIARSSGGWAQLLDAGHVLGIDHLSCAYSHARRAAAQGRNVTTSLEMEFLLYASGARQISKAIEIAGVKPMRPFVVAGEGLELAKLLRRFHWSRDDSVLEARAEKLRGFGFTAKEVESAGDSALDLALEMVARVDLLK